MKVASNFFLSFLYLFLLSPLPFQDSLCEEWMKDFCGNFPAVWQNIYWKNKIKPLRKLSIFFHLSAADWILLNLYNVLSTVIKKDKLKGQWEGKWLHTS